LAREYLQCRRRIGDVNVKLSGRAIQVRWLRRSDVPALIELERRQWQAHQAADAQALHLRIERHPQLSVGAFCSNTGAALCSLFMKPMTQREIAALHRGATWSHCAQQTDAPIEHAGLGPRALFGISLTSADSQAVRSVMAFFYPHALRAGWRRIYLGSPMPGLAKALQQCPGLTANDYASTVRGGLPLDPQLRYYHRHGFKTLVSVRAGYFPHEPSLDHGAILLGHVPLARLHPLWRALPTSWLRPLSRLLFKFL
jgi:hypothetical protein